MSHIIDFQIENLAGRTKPFAHTLDRHTNIFFGLNGCGKTSLLKILHSAMSNDPAILARVPFSTARVTIHSLNFRQNFVRTIEKKQLKGQDPTIEDDRAIRVDEGNIIHRAERQRKALKWKTEPMIKEAMTTKWAHQYLPTSRLVLGRGETLQWPDAGSREVAQMPEEQIDLFFAETIRQLWIRYTSYLLADVRKAQESGLASILKAVLAPPKTRGRKKRSEHETHQAFLRMKKFVSRQGEANLLDSEVTFKARYDADVTLRRVVQDIDHVESQIEQFSAPRDRLVELFKELFTGGKRVTFSDRAIEISATDGTDIGVSSLSSGEKHILRLLVETLLARENALIVDEPELSLHINWQKRLVEMMRTLSPDAQLILATHSPEVMADIQDQFIVRM